MLGEGPANILFDGKRIEGTWKKSDVVSRTVFYDMDGKEVVFPRGNIFVEVIPSDREVNLNRMIKFIVVDLDDTLIGLDLRVSSRNKKANQASNKKRNSGDTSHRPNTSNRGTICK